MRTPEEIEIFNCDMTIAGLSCSSPRANRARSDFKDGVDASECIKTAIAHEAQARAMWVELALDPWCKRHGITRAQALSIAFYDDLYNPENPSIDRVTLKSLFWGAGQHHDFSHYLIAQAKVASSPEPELKITASQALDQLVDAAKAGGCANADALAEIISKLTGVAILS